MGERPVDDTRRYCDPPHCGPSGATTTQGRVDYADHRRAPVSTLTEDSPASTGLVADDSTTKDPRSISTALGADVAGGGLTAHEQGKVVQLPATIELALRGGYVPPRRV